MTPRYTQKQFEDAAASGDSDRTTSAMLTQAAADLERLETFRSVIVDAREKNIQRIGQSESHQVRLAHQSYVMAYDFLLLELAELFPAAPGGRDGD